jgi:hypothetical protein
VISIIADSAEPVALLVQAGRFSDEDQRLAHGDQNRYEKNQ